MRKSIAIAAMAALLASPVLADNNDTKTVTVGGKVVASLALTVVGNVTMPDVVLPDGGETTSVTLACDASGNSTVTYDGNGGNPFADGTSTNTTVQVGSSNTVVGNSTGTCVNLTVAGEPNFFYQAAYSVTTATPATNGTGITLSAPTCSSAAAAGDLAAGTAVALDGSGADTLHCGATITVADNAAATSYAGAEFTVAVTYD